jgi:flagellar motor protein MotB
MNAQASRTRRGLLFPVFLVVALGAPLSSLAQEVAPPPPTTTEGGQPGAEGQATEGAEGQAEEESPSARRAREEREAREEAERKKKEEEERKKKEEEERLKAEAAAKLKAEEDERKKKEEEERLKAEAEKRKADYAALRQQMEDEWLPGWAIGFGGEWIFSDLADLNSPIYEANNIAPVEASGLLGFSLKGDLYLNRRVITSLSLGYTATVGGESNHDLTWLALEPGLVFTEKSLQLILSLKLGLAGYSFTGDRTDPETRAVVSGAGYEGLGSIIEPGLTIRYQGSPNFAVDVKLGFRQFVPFTETDLNGAAHIDDLPGEIAGNELLSYSGPMIGLNFAFGDFPDPIPAPPEEPAAEEAPAPAAEEKKEEPAPAAEEKQEAPAPAEEKKEEEKKEEEKKEEEKAPEGESPSAKRAREEREAREKAASEGEGGEAAPAEGAQP